MCGTRTLFFELTLIRAKHLVRMFLNKMSTPFIAAPLPGRQHEHPPRPIVGYDAGRLNLDGLIAPYANGRRVDCLNGIAWNASQPGMDHHAMFCTVFKAIEAFLPVLVTA